MIVLNLENIKSNISLRFNIQNTKNTINQSKTKQFPTNSSKPELGKEPPILPGLKPLLEPLIRLLQNSHLLILTLKNITSNNLLQINIKSVTSWRQMLVVHKFHVSLHTCFLRWILLYNLSWILLDPCNKTMAVSTVTGSVVEILHMTAFFSA